MATILGIDLSKNISLFSVPVAFVLAFAPVMYVGATAGKNLDQANPRTLKDNLDKDTSLDKITKGRIARAKAASENAFETLGLFAGAVVAANQAGIPAETLNTLTLSYLASRVAYIYAYIWLCENRNLAPLRSLFWMGGVGVISTLWVKAGLVLYSS